MGMSAMMEELGSEAALSKLQVQTEQLRMAELKGLRRRESGRNELEWKLS